MSIETRIDQAANILAAAKHVVALTGAGISTPSGIPDYRSIGSGLWERVNPFEVATLVAFRRNPEAFYHWVRPLVRKMLDARPNPAHLALVDLEQMGVLQAVITQNIDSLHRRAGSRTVYEVHGHLREATCIRCYRSVPADDLIASFLENPTVPHCEVCGGVIKPNIILYGEQLPVRVMLAAQQSARESDVMIVVGSSLEVAPAGDLPLLTRERGGCLIFVNLGTTHLDPMAEVIIQADVADALPRLVEAVRHRRIA